MENYAEKFMDQLTGFTDTVKGMVDVKPAEMLSQISDSQQEFMQKQMDNIGDYFQSVTKAMTGKAS